MEQRRFGTSGLMVSVLSFGTMTIGDRDRIGKMGNLGDSGVTTIDAAHVYSFGCAEEILGEALRGRRDDFVLVSKRRKTGLRKRDRTALSGTGRGNAQYALAKLARSAPNFRDACGWRKDFNRRTERADGTCTGGAAVGLHAYAERASRNVLEALAQKLVKAAHLDAPKEQKVIPINMASGQ